MKCPLCEARAARRTCPGIRGQICPVCCGTKRLVEISCPPDCPYLTSARTHPASVVARRRERQARFVDAVLQGTSPRVARLLLTLQQGVRRYRKSAIPPLVDADVADAAGSLAGTLETAARGIIYEHQPTSLPAQRLLYELRQMLESIRRAAGSALDADAPVALRRLERMAREAATHLEPKPTALLDFIDSLPNVPESPPDDAAARDAASAVPAGGQPTSGSRIILP